MNNLLLEDLESEKQKLNKAAKLHWFHWLILITSILITVFIWYYLEVQSSTKNQREFSIESARTTELLVERMQKYEEALRSGVATINALNSNLTRAQWIRFSESLQIEKRYPGINGIGVINQISPDDKQDYLANMQSIYPNFEIYPKHPSEDSWPITYIEPFKSNHKALGLDIAHEKHRYQAALLAKSSGRAQITAPIVLVQDQKQTPGFLFFMPYYRQGTAHNSTSHPLFAGLVYAPFIVNKLMLGVLDQSNRQVNLRVSDQQHLLFDEFVHSNPEFDDNPQFKKTQSIELYGRVWGIEIWSNRSFNASREITKSWIVLVGGVLIYFLLFLLFVFLSRANKQALAFADTTYNYHRFKNFYLSSVVDNVNEGLITIDVKGNIQTVNKACLELFEYEAHELIGQNLKMLMPKEVADQHDSHLANYLKTRVRKVIGIGRQLVAQTKSGRLFPVDLSVSEIDLNGQVIYSGVLRDLSQTQDYENEMLKVLQFQKMITESIPDLLFVKDKDFKIVQANDAFIAMYPEEVRDKVIGYTTLESYRDSEREEFLKLDRLAFKQGESEKEETIQFPDGVVRTLLTKKKRFYDPNGDVFILGLARDISEVKRFEDKILNSNKQLDDFAYIASHDLKEPLRGIFNHASFLFEDCESILDDDAKHKVNRIIFLAKRMEAFITDLLYYSRLGRVELGIVDTNLNDIVADIYEMLSDDKTVKIICKDKMPIIHCDKIRITEVLRNLIVNGIKYNDSAEKVIEVGLHSDKIEEDGHRIVFYVKDNGIGIPEKFHTEIFRIFKRLHRVDAYGGGTGSGLTFVQQIVEAHGGKVWLESKEGEGTMFYFSLLSKS